MVIILMGVAGSGKSTVGRLLAGQLGWTFIEGDDFHPQANIDKMADAIPLTDSDRIPWLHTLHEQIHTLYSRGQHCVMACSALRKKYRDLLREPHREIYFVYLRGDADLVRQRLAGRQNHYMKTALLASQFAAMEEPDQALVVDIGPPPDRIARRIIKELALAVLDEEKA